MKDQKNGEPLFRPAGVIFDMDGLMLDTERPMFGLWIVAAEKSGWNIESGDVEKTLGLSERATEEFFLQKYGSRFPYREIRAETGRLTDELFEREGIAHKPGLLTLLDHLAALGLPLAVATSSDRDAALWKIKKANIDGRFAAVVCGDEVEKSKPAPDIFLLAAAKLGMPPSACVGFEDSPAGLMGLAAAGIRPVFIKDLVEPPPEILKQVWRRFPSLAAGVEIFSVV
jgi:HAD superfamily hydrolase (TIGR01509 family)